MNTTIQCSAPGTQNDLFVRILQETGSIFDSPLEIFILFFSQILLVGAYYIYSIQSSHQQVVREKYDEKRKELAHKMYMVLKKSKKSKKSKKPKKPLFSLDYVYGLLYNNDEKQPTCNRIYAIPQNLTKKITSLFSKMIQQKLEDAINAKDLYKLKQLVDKVEKMLQNIPLKNQQIQELKNKANQLLKIKTKKTGNETLWNLIKPTVPLYLFSVLLKIVITIINSYTFNAQTKALGNIEEKGASFIQDLSTGFIICQVIKGSFDTLQRALQNKAKESFKEKLEIKTFYQFQKQDLEYQVKKKVKFTTMQQQSLNQFTELIYCVPLQIISQFARIGTAIFFICQINYSQTLLFLTIVSGAALGVIQYYIIKILLTFWKKKTAINQTLCEGKNDITKNIQSTKLHNPKKTNINIKKEIQNNMIQSREVLFIDAITWTIFSILFCIQRTYFIHHGSILIEEKLITTATLLSLVGQVDRIVWGLRRLMESISQITKIFPLLQDIIELLNSEPTIRSGQITKRLKGEIVFDQVKFKYDGIADDAFILKDVSFKIKQGQRVAIVGASGCGKSTILKLMHRLYDLDAGDITFDGNSIKDYNLNFRYEIAKVSQDPSFFEKRSFLENLSLSCQDPPSKKKIIEACKKAGIWDKIKSLPDSLDTKGTSTLSGGEKQRLAIARILLQNPSIILLDEATSALDAESARKVQKAINDLCEELHEVTTITIAHDLNTIKSSDKILFLSKGRIVEEGTHDELLASNGQYKKMWEAHTNH